MDAVKVQPSDIKNLCGKKGELPITLIEKLKADGHAMDDIIEAFQRGFETGEIYIGTNAMIFSREAMPYPGVGLSVG
jgi:hypothetical protein